MHKNETCNSLTYECFFFDIIDHCYMFRTMVNKYTLFFYDLGTICVQNIALSTQFFQMSDVANKIRFFVRFPFGFRKVNFFQ